MHVATAPCAAHVQGRPFVLHVMRRAARLTRVRQWWVGDPWHLCTVLHVRFLTTSNHSAIAHDRSIQQHLNERM